MEQEREKLEASAKKRPGCNNGIEGFHQNRVTFKRPKLPDVLRAQKIASKNAVVSGSFLRSDTETDFPKPVRSAKRSRFAATVFVRSKSVNWVRILPQMFTFLTDTTKTDILHILVRTHLLVLTCQHSCMLLVIIDQIC